MEKERKAYAPFSLTSEAGVAQTPVEGYIDVVQKIFPSVTTGSINENGKWTGVKSDDEDFIGITKAVAIGSGATTLFPDTNNHPLIDMTGFNDLQIAIKSTRAESIALKAVFGPDIKRFANLDPIATGTTAKLTTLSRSTDDAFTPVLDDTAEVTVADAWIIYTIIGRAKGQKNLQIKLTNNGGDPTDYEFAFRRLV
tara:strand:- start:403 stop:993 length:591 start_codon:yes stop_codon:yes gene_type:complete